MDMGGLNMTEQERFVRDLRIVMQDLTQIEMDHDLWRGLNENLLVNPHCGEPGDVMNFITRAHFASLGIGLRRQIDTDERSVSLANLIGRVAGRQILFSRAAFVQRYADAYPSRSDLGAEIGDRDFSRLVNDERARIYAPARAFRHLEWLKKKGDPLRRFVNTQVAHRSSKSADGPTLHYHQRLLWVMQRLWEHYNWLATGSYPRLGDGLLGDDWKDALRRPWMPLGACACLEGLT